MSPSKLRSQILGWLCNLHFASGTFVVIREAIPVESLEKYFVSCLE
jgi:hypothetical protein